MQGGACSRGQSREELNQKKHEFASWDPPRICFGKNEKEKHLFDIHFFMVTSSRAQSPCCRQRTWPVRNSCGRMTSTPSCCAAPPSLPIARNNTLQGSAPLPPHRDVLHFFFYFLPTQPKPITDHHNETNAQHQNVSTSIIVPKPRGSPRRRIQTPPELSPRR